MAVLWHDHRACGLSPATDREAPATLPAGSQMATKTGGFRERRQPTPPSNPSQKVHMAPPGLAARPRRWRMKAALDRAAAVAGVIGAEIAARLLVDKLSRAGL